MNLVKLDDFSNTIVEIDNSRKLCETLLRTPHYAKLGQDGIYAIVAKARSLEMDPMDALNGALYYVNGRVGMSSEAMAARMRQAGHSITKDPKSDNTICVLHGRRADNGDTWTTTFSIDDAKRAGIYNERGPWGKYPGVMCYNRALSMLFRQLTPDLSKGAGYTLDELREISSNSDSQQITVRPIQTIVEVINHEQMELLERVFSFCDPDYLEKVWSTLKKSAGINKEEFEKIPANLFDRLYSAAKKNADEYQLTITEQTTEEEPIAVGES